MVYPPPNGVCDSHSDLGPEKGYMRTQKSNMLEFPGIVF